MRVTVTLLLLVANVALGQTNAAHSLVTGRVRGWVRDSTANAPLANATVQLVTGSFIRSAITDSAGMYSIGDVPLGNYTIGFLHPILDSIGIEAPLQRIVVSSSNENVVNLAVPPPARIKLAVCGEVTASDPGGMIIGTVHDAGSGAPLTQATVTAEWLDYVISRTGLSPKLRNVTAITVDSGWFALCNLPSSGNVTLIAARGADTTGTIELEIPASGYLRRSMYLGKTVREKAGTAGPSKSRSLDRAMHLGDGTISGRVLSVEGTHPIPNADVMIIDGPSVRTNENGEFILSNAPSGTQRLEVRAVGYYPQWRQVNVIPNAPLVNVSLATLKAILDTIKITAKHSQAGPDDGGFARRRRSAMGRFVTVTDMIRFPVINTSDVFRRIPRMRTEGNKLEMRGAFQSNQGSLGGENWCQASIFLNGHNVSFMSIEDINDWVHPDEVAGIEVYSEGTVPPQFQVGLSGCGSVVIWTK